MKNVLQGLLVLAALASSCVRKPSVVPVGDDRSIRFPEFRDQAAVVVGETSGPYQLDGAMLRAIMLAANDFMPPDSEKQHCLFRQESQFYRVIRQGALIFVQISYNTAACDTKLGVLDGGARYAISIDGRILRRLVGIEPDGFPREERPGKSIPVPNSMVGSSMAEPNWDALPPSIRRKWQDAGTGSTPPGPSPAPHTPPDGGVATTDGGLPGGTWDGGS